MMSTFSRRYFLSSLAVLGLSAAVSLPALAATPMQVVYHISEGNDQAQRAFANIGNQLRAEPDTRIVVVALGHGVEFLLEGAKDKSGTPFADGVAALSATDFHLA